MIAKSFAKDQIMRLGGLDRFPREEPMAVNELVLALMNAPSEAIARNAIDSYMAEMTVCPKPAEIRRVLFDLSTDKEWAPIAEENAPTYCERCNGTGWVHERRLVHLPSYGQAGRWNDYAGRCSCRPVRKAEVVPMRRKS